MDESIPMSKIQDGLWILDVLYQNTIDNGFHCEGCLGKGLEQGDDLKIHFYGTIPGIGELKMIGPAFRIPLPISGASMAFDTNPKFTFYPNFLQKQGSLRSLDITSDHPMIGTRNIAVYLPPSFTENPPLEYDVLYWIDLNFDFAEYILDILDKLFTDIG